MWNSVEVYGSLANFLVCFHGGFVISNSNFKSIVVEPTYTGDCTSCKEIAFDECEVLPNKIIFTSLCTRESLEKF